jgi:heme/copper-type cytochrome/quinol oxidase subunit 2
MTYAAPPGTAPKKPSIAGIVLAVLLIVLGPLIGTVVTVVSAVGSVEGISDAHPYVADSDTAQVDLASGEEMGVWVSINRGYDCQITFPSGQILTATAGPGMRTVVNNYNLAMTFVATQPGTYTVLCRSSESGGYTFKIAPPLEVAPFAAGILTGVLIIVAGVLGGVAMLIITIVRRVGWSRQYGPRATPPYPYQSPSRRLPLNPTFLEKCQRFAR